MNSSLTIRSKNVNSSLTIRSRQPRPTALQRTRTPRDLRHGAAPVPPRNTAARRVCTSQEIHKPSLARYCCRTARRIKRFHRWVAPRARH
eukprot:2302651-Prymnesium_polylepis.1